VLRLYGDRNPESPWVFPHRSGRHAGQPVQDIKNGFHAALAIAGIQTSRGTTCGTRLPRRLFGRPR